MLHVFNITGAIATKDDFSFTNKTLHEAVTNAFKNAKDWDGNRG